MQYPKKITCRTIGLDTRELETIATENGTKQVAVMRAWGIVAGRKTEHSTIGSGDQTYTRYIGQFGAFNLISGEEYRSEQLIVPGVAETVINSLFEKAMKASDGEVVAAQIGLDILISENKSLKGGTKFSYAVKPLIVPQGQDVLDIMAKDFPAFKLLSAPAEKKSRR